MVKRDSQIPNSYKETSRKGNGDRGKKGDNSDDGDNGDNGNNGDDDTKQQ